jgi:hypothetical protein
VFVGDQHLCQNFCAMEASSSPALRAPGNPRQRRQFHAAPSRRPAHDATLARARFAAITRTRSWYRAATPPIIASAHGDEHGVKTAHLLFRLHAQSALPGRHAGIIAGVNSTAPVCESALAAGGQRLDALLPVTDGCAVLRRRSTLF